MRPAPVVSLDPETRRSLEATVRKPKAAVREVVRAQIILKAAEGLANTEIAAQLGLDVKTVGKWRRRFCKYGAAGLIDAPRSGRKPTHGPDVIEKILRTTLERKPRNRTHWSVRALAEELGIGKTTVWKVWRAHQIKPHLERTFKLSNDPDFVEKVRDVAGLHLNPPENALALSVDEKSRIQALDRTRPGLPMRKGRNGTRTHDYVRHGTCCLFAALNVVSGEVLARCEKRHRHQEYLRFLRQIDRTVSKDLDVHLIADNYATHRHSKVKRWLERHPRFQVHFIPTSSSWLNMVERFFAALTEDRLRRGVFRSVLELIAAIDEYIQNRNQAPKPFLWTKTADEIIAKVAPLHGIIQNTTD